MGELNSPITFFYPSRGPYFPIAAKGNCDSVRPVGTAASPLEISQLPESETAWHGKMRESKTVLRTILKRAELNGDFIRGRTAVGDIDHLGQPVVLAAFEHH